MRGCEVYTGKKKGEIEIIAKKTYENGLLSQIKNALGCYVGRNVRVREGGKVKMKNGGAVLVDNDGDNPEAEAKRNREALLNDPNKEILEVKGDTVKWRYKI